MAREAKYKVDVDAAVKVGAELTSVTLTKKGIDGKTYEQPSKEISITDGKQALAFLSGNQEHLWSLFTDRANAMIQANDRRKLNVAAEGPKRAIDDAVESLVDSKVYDTAEEAREFVIDRMKAKGTIPADYVYGVKVKKNDTEDNDADVNDDVPAEAEAVN
jgi:hypothetical protein